MAFISLQAQKANYGIAGGFMILNEKTEFTGFKDDLKWNYDNPTETFLDELRNNW